MVQERKETQDHFHVIQAARFGAKQLAPRIVIVQRLKNADELTMVQCNAYFLGLKIHSTCVQTLENDIDTALVLAGFVLPDDGRVNDTIVEPAPILCIQILVALSLEALLDIGKPIGVLMYDALVVGVKRVEPLVPIEHQQAPRLLLYEKDARNRQPQQERLDEAVGLGRSEEHT